MRVFRADELDGAPCELDRAWCGADMAGEPGGPGAEPGQVNPGEPGRVRHRRPQREHPLQVRVSLREAEHSLRLPGRFDGGGECLGRAARRRPVRRKLRRSRHSTARELSSKPRVQPFALPRQDRRVDRLSEERMPEAEAPGCRLGHEDAVLHCLAERVAQFPLRQLRDCAKQRVADFASGCRGQAQQGLGRVAEASDALQEEITQATRELAASIARSG
jgi:hypothetical protein